MSIRSLLACGLFVSAGAAAAQTPLVTTPDVACFPIADNQVVTATVKPEVGGASVRIYFRWNEHGAMYYVDMVAAGAGSYWGLPAKAEPRNERIEYYVSVVDPYGKTLAKSETKFSVVRDDCEPSFSSDPKLAARQQGLANNLVIGETVAAQEGKRVLGFLCDGVVTRINADGIMRPDEVCRGCVIPWWTKQEFIGAAMLVPATLIIIDEPPEPSRSRP
ncbi:MAG TPA: hypothetical protein VF017_22680 [Thermoanaerobaculia bacterium]|nr:hypothetical protein [Thermoanaerobaculia bacterium]